LVAYFAPPFVAKKYTKLIIIKMAHNQDNNERSDQKIRRVDSFKYRRRFGFILTSNKENLKALKDDTEEVERMLKALIKSLEKKRLDP
jgi:hypothetical protein